MYTSSVSLNPPPSPRRKASETRSAIVSGNGVVVVRLPLVAVIDRTYVPRGERGVVFTRRVDVNRVGPPEGETVQVVSAGHPTTLRETGPDVSPKIRTVADAE